MTLQVIGKELIMDRVEVCLRLGENNFVSLNIVQDILGQYIHHDEATHLQPRWYPNNQHPSQVVQIPLSNDGRHCLTVESGTAIDRNKAFRPYVKFVFNVKNLAINETARSRFNSVMADVIPSGGYQVLLHEGYVLYAEFSADFRGVGIESLDAYCPTLDQGRYFIRDGIIKTINLHDSRPGRPEAFCAYDKKQADWELRKHLRRGPLVRIEAKRRLNRTPTYRQLRLCEVHGIPNPFASLRIYDRKRIEQVFTAARHKGFLADVRRGGVQDALAKTRGADRDRRERMLENCRADWWNPEQAWAGRFDAVNLALQL